MSETALHNLNYTHEPPHAHAHTNTPVRRFILYTGLGVVFTAQLQDHKKAFVKGNPYNIILLSLPNQHVKDGSGFNSSIRLLRVSRC